MKPMHSKPFDIAHAQAGAPFSFDDGESAEIIAWSRSGAMSLVSMKGQHQSLVLSRVDGTSGGMATLVMLPIGEIANLPVFVGDKCIGYDGAPFVATARMGSDWSHFSWPAPAKVYPKTLMSAELLESYCHGSGGSTASLFRIANAAICHAIDAGQVVIAVDHDQVFIAEVKK